MRQADVNAKQAQRALRDFHLDDRSVVSSNTSRIVSRKPVPRPNGASPRKHSGSSSHRHSKTREGLPANIGVTRRHTTLEGEGEGDGDIMLRRQSLTRSSSLPSPDVDMHLAYGEIPPPLEVGPAVEEAALKHKLLDITRILDEANCVQHSVSSTISSLQKNPEAMAAVALALAEVSNVVKVMAPGALTAIKGSFPAIFALLASPQFLIAVGVAAGVTVVCFGGYKIIKKIQSNKEEKMLELEEIDSDVSRIESWRRGIAEAEVQSIATSVDGEFITPEAAAMRRAERGESTRKDKKRAKTVKGSKTTAKTVKTSKSKKEKRTKDKKEPNALQLFFKASS